MSEKKTALFSEVHLGIKKETVNKLYRIVLLIHVYPDDKKVLKQIQKIIKAEKKYFKKQRFTWGEEEQGKMSIMLEDINDVISDLRKVKSVGRYNRVYKDLDEITAKLRSGLDIEDRMAEGLKSFIQGAKEKVKVVKETIHEGIDQVRELCATKDDPSTSA